VTALPATIRRLLVANRGEIAVRICATARRLGIATVAVFSEADAEAMHVAVADQAFCIGPPPAQDSYLDIAAILAAARASGADSIHPGYGFLSENPLFAEACSAAGLVFVGPPAAAMRAMASKSAAKALMVEAGVPVVPGYFGADQSTAALRRAAHQIGYPLLIKAAAGGGGKGMKIVSAPGDFADALASAQREASSAFGDATVLLEKYLAQARHIEMQIFADRFGNQVHLFERDCSLQRRYQKVIEEAPACRVTPDLRMALAETALAAAAAVGYVGAGTVEFIVEDGQFYFMEMNTRLQVEHPVTEAITGLDLVEWQIRVARGEPLPLRQPQLVARGHAIEARLYAEDPERDFLPQTGLLQHLRWPEGVRVDSGVRQGDRIGRHYDPMLAKIIAVGADRDQAIARLDRALAATEIVGVANNRQFLRAVLAQPAFVAGEFDTQFLARNAASLRSSGESDPTLLALAALAVLRRAERAHRESADPADPFSPWGRAAGWRLAGAASVTVTLDGHCLAVQYETGGFLLALPSGPCRVQGDCDAAGNLSARLDAARITARAIFAPASLTLLCGGREARFALPDPAAAAASQAAAGHLVAPMPGQVTKLFVALGAMVEKGAPLMVIEAMKMEHTITAPWRGRVAKLPFVVGDIVPDSADLLQLDADATPE
jgi:3-methylcrotonyl-CoA carboxylase alpha subunit